MDEPVVLSQPQPNRTPILIASAVSGLVFLFLGFLLGRNLPLKQIVINPTPVPVSTPAPTTTPSSSWKTYQNTANKFEIQYPGDWTSDITSPSYIVLKDQINSLMIADSNSEFMNECMQETKSEPITLGQTKFLKRFFHEINFGQMCTNPDPQSRQIWLIPQDPKYSFGMIFFYKAENRVSSEALYDQILSTFKFLDQAVPNSSSPLSSECDVCGPQSAIHNPDGRQCAPGLECTNQSPGIFSSVYFCIKPGDSIQKCP